MRSGRQPLPWVAMGVLVIILCVRGAGKKGEENYGTEGMCLDMCLGTSIGTALGGNTGLGLSLGQHRTIWQEDSARIFDPIQSLKNGGILYVFPVLSN